MKSKGILWIMALLIGGTIASAAQESLRKQSVAVVYNVLDEEQVDRLEDYGLWLSRIGKRDASRQVTRLCREGFGSGFVVEQEGRCMLVTNSHVVGIGATANVAFIQGKDTLKFDACRCVYQDTHRDLAILRLPVEANAKVVPLNLTNAKLSDGMEVYTAGFPALADRPSWQFGKGIISNAELLIPELNERYETAYIQHTAQIDAGSSGGPLLIKANGDGYEVIGINTLKAREREGVGIALPADDIREALALRGENDMQIYLATLDTVSIEKYAKLYQAVPQAVVEHQNELFERGYVLEGLAYVIQYADTATWDAKKAKKEKKQAAIEAAKTNTSSSKTKQNTGRSDYYGIDRDGDKQAIYFAGNFFFPSAGLLANMKLGNVGLGYHYTAGTFFRTGGLLQLAMKDMGGTSQKYGVNVTYTLGVQLPLALGKVKLIPYVTPDIGITYYFNDNMWSMLNYGMFAGLEFGVPVGNSTFILGVDYDLQGLVNLGRNARKLEAGAVHGVGAHLGIAF